MVFRNIEVEIDYFRKFDINILKFFKYLTFNSI